MAHEAVEFLSNPDMYELTRKTHVLETIDSTEGNVEDNNINNNTDPDYVVEPPSFQMEEHPFQTEFQPVPLQHKYDVQVDCKIKTVPGDGACFYHCAAEWLLGSQCKMQELTLWATAYGEVLAPQGGWAESAPIP